MSDNELLASPREAVAEPQGIPFFSIRTGETHWGKLEPTIQAYINSSDMGINASRDQDYGWRLHPDWVKKVKDFKRDRTQMSILMSKNEGRKPTTTQILYYMYGQQLEEYFEDMEDNESPFEEAYLAAINGGMSVQEAAERAGMPRALADFRAASDDDEVTADDIADLIDDVMDDDDELETPTPPEEAPSAPSEPTTPAESPAPASDPKPTTAASDKPASKPKATQK